MGMKNSGAQFQKFINSTLNGLIMNFCYSYIDDVIIYSTNFKNHLMHLREVLTRLSDANLRLNIQKCKFATESCIYLGHRLSNEGISPDESKIEIIKNLKAPTNLKELRAALGLIGYYRKFFSKFSKQSGTFVRAVKKG